MTRVQFYIDDEEAEFFDEYARLKGLELTALAKMSTFSYVTRNPRKGLEMPIRIAQSAKDLQRHATQD